MTQESQGKKTREFIIATVVGILLDQLANGYIFAINFAVAQNQLSTEQLEQHNPQPCTGYNPQVQKWGYEWMIRPDLPNSFSNFCPENFAIYSTDDPSIEFDKYSRFRINCCPLPARDILLPEHIEVEMICPSGYLVTGMSCLKVRTAERPFYKRQTLRCTKVNQQRYILGEDDAGAYWGVGMNMNDLFKGTSLKKADIPLAIRQEAGRMHKFLWDGDGCIGQPAGSLFSGTSSGQCGDFIFRQLKFRHSEYGRPPGAPVQMFPNCLAISDIFATDPECITGPTAITIGATK